MMAFVLPPPTFFCFCLVSGVVGAISGQRATSRHGAEIEKKTWKDKIMGKEEVHWRRLKEDDQVELSHVVDVCKAEPGSKPLDFSTIVKFRPCVNNQRAEVSWDYFLATVNFSMKATKLIIGKIYGVELELFDRDITDEKVKEATKNATCICWKIGPKNDDRCEADKLTDQPKVKNTCFTKTPFELRPGFHSNVASDIKVSWFPDLDIRFDNKTKAFACDKTAGSAKSTFKMVIKAPKLVNGTKRESRPRRKTTSTTKTTTTTTTKTTKEEVEEVDRLPLEILFGDYIFVTTYKKREKMTTHYAVRGVHGGHCGRKVEDIEKVTPNFAKVGITIGSLFIGGFVVIVIIATAYYTHQWRKSKKRRLQLSQRDLTAPMKQEEEEEEEAVVMPREDVVLGSAPEPGEIPADAGIKAERRNVASVATSASSSTSGLAPASAPSHAPSVAFNVSENVVTIRGRGGRNKNNNNNDNKNNNVSVGSFMRGTRGADGKPSFRAFCDHPVVVGIWSLLLVGNVTALIVSLALLPITHPVTNADEQGSS